MSSEDQLYKDILKLNVAELRRELERNALPATGRKAELIQRLYKFTKRELITSQGGSPEDSVRGEKSQDKNESISKTPSRIPRLLPNIEEINKSVRSRLDTTSSIRDRNRILEQDLLSVQLEEPDIDLFGHSKYSGDKRDEDTFLHEQFRDNGQRSREHSGQTKQTGQLSNIGQPRFQVNSDELKYDTDHREYEFAGHVGDNGHGGNSDHDNIVQEINEMKVIMKTQSNMVYQMEKDMDLKINSWSKKILEAVQHKAPVTADTTSDDISNSNEMEKLRRKYKFYGSAIEMILLEISEFNHGEVSKAEMENSLHRLNEKEEQCGSIVQEIITLQTDESIVDKEIRVWTEFQQRILRASRKVERFISQLNKDEEAEQRSIEDRTPLKECRESNSKKRERVTAQSLRYLYDTLVNRYHTLEQYEPNLEVCHRILVPIFQSKLPNDIRRKWEYELSKLENEEEDKRVTAEFFFDFLRSHVMSEEAIEKSTPNRSTHSRMSNTPCIQNKDQGDSRFSSATALAAQSIQETVRQGRSNQSKCGFCEKNHESKNSYAIKKKSVDERIQTVKDKGLCFNCLKPVSSTHYSSRCMSQGCMIEGCQRKHHTLLHRASSSPKTEVTKDEKVSSSERVEATVKSHVGVMNGILKADSENKMRLLPTAKAKLIQNGTETDVRILIDSGSDHSYIKQDIADSLGMQSEGPSTLMTIHMHGGQSRTIKVRNFKFTLTALDGSKSADVSAWAVDKVCTPLEAVPVDISKYRYLKGLKFRPVGSDLKKRTKEERDASSPIATNSIFGWMISGNVDVGSEYHPSNRAMTNCATVRTIEEELNLDLKRFWQLESLEIDESDKRFTKDEESAMQQFKDRLVYDGERYEVALPWREDCTGLEDNRHQAVSRLVKIEKRLQYDKEKASMYQDAINHYLTYGHAREIDKMDSNSETKINYLPHHPIFCTDKVTTKCRIVFDASSKNKNGVSLNDCLLPGPVLQPNLVSIIIRFRLHRIALMADIRKMFLQIKLAKQDQNVHRFLWRDFNTKIEPKTYCMTRLTFGDVSSPFEAIATVQHHAEVNKESFPEASETIKENM
eukprot:Seg1363.25 transcript_id=Seg1363.25/GoldUCD/mRNA.D3Y31 product="hypothetical protein" protein_id=Seg1363.25/GoldUCD/D3Y31